MSQAKNLITYQRPLTHCLIAGTPHSLGAHLSAGNRGDQDACIPRLKMVKNYTKEQQKKRDLKTARQKAKKSDATASSRRTTAKIGPRYVVRCVHAKVELFRLFMRFVTRVHECENTG